MWRSQGRSRSTAPRSLPTCARRSGRGSAAPSPPRAGSRARPSRFFATTCATSPTATDSRCFVLCPELGQKGIDGVARRVVGAMPLRDAPIEHEPDALAHAARGRRLAGPQQRGDDADDIVAGDGIDRSIGDRRRVREAASPVRLVSARRLPPVRAQRDARIEPPAANVGIAAARLRSAIGSMPRWRLRTLSKAMSRASERLTTGQGPRPKLRRLPSMVRR